MNIYIFTYIYVYIYISMHRFPHGGRSKSTVAKRAQAHFASDKPRSGLRPEYMYSHVYI